MPIHTSAKICQLEEAAFRQITFDVMGHVFDIHNEFGRFFDEKIYKRELARRRPGVQLEVPIEVRFEDFAKTYFLDALVEGGAAFEFKTVESLADRHRSQLLHYLFMVDLPHGKLVVVPNNSRVRDSIPLFSSPTFSCLIVKEVI